MERPFEDVFPIKNGDIPLLYCLPECTQKDLGTKKHHQNSSLPPTPVTCVIQDLFVRIIQNLVCISSAPMPKTKTMVDVCLKVEEGSSSLTEMGVLTISMCLKRYRYRYIQIKYKPLIVDW